MPKLELTMDSLLSLADHLRDVCPGRFAEGPERIEELLRQEGGNLWMLADCIERDGNIQATSGTGYQIVYEVFWWLVQEMAEQNER